MISDLRRKRHEQEQTYGSADHRCAPWTKLPVSVASARRRSMRGRRSTAASMSARHNGCDPRRRELASEASGCGLESGPGDAERGHRKKRPELVDRRTDACWLRSQCGASERRVCGLMSIAVSSYRYRSRRSDESLGEKLMRLAREKPKYRLRQAYAIAKFGEIATNFAGAGRTKFLTKDVISH